MLTANGLGLTNGGLPLLFWSLVSAYIGQLFVVLSLAEVASIFPTAGAQYRESVVSFCRSDSLLTTD